MCIYGRHIIKAVSSVYGTGMGSGHKCTGVGWQRDPYWWERDGRGRGVCGNGRARDGITCPVQHSIRERQFQFSVKKVKGKGHQTSKTLKN